MICPKCGSEQISVIGSKSDTKSVKRRRMCHDCGFRWNTIEVEADTHKKLHEGLLKMAFILEQIRKLAKLIEV